MAILDSIWAICGQNFDNIWKLSRQYSYIFGQYIVNVFDNILTIFWQYLDNLWIIFWQYLDTIFWQYLEKILAVFIQYLDNSQCFRQYLDSIWTIYRYLDNIWAIFGQYLVNMILSKYCQDIVQNIDYILSKYCMTTAWILPSSASTLTPTSTLVEVSLILQFIFPPNHPDRKSILTPSRFYQ